MPFPSVSQYPKRTAIFYFLQFSNIAASSSSSVTRLRRGSSISPSDMKSLDHWSSIFRYFLLPCMWILSFSSQFLSVCTVKMQTKAGLRRKEPKPGIRKYLNMLLQRSRDFMSGEDWSRCRSENEKKTSLGHNVKEKRVERGKRESGKVPSSEPPKSFGPLKVSIPSLLIISILRECSCSHFRIL